MEFRELETICIIGPGLIGGSLGLALQAAGFDGRIVALAQDPSDAEMAVSFGTAHEAQTRMEALPENIGLYCLAVPMSVMTPTIRKLAERIHAENTLVTDVGSVKCPVVDAAAAALPFPASFVGAHPMAGSHHRGVTFARADLFQKATVVLTPVTGTGDTALNCVRSLWEAVGAEPVLMNPRQHDEIVARVSHLPHALAALLIHIAAADDGLDIASSGLVDMTRLASADASLWRDILVSNRDQVRDAITKLIEELQRLDAWLERNDEGQIERTLARAARVRSNWVERRYERHGWTD